MEFRTTVGQEECRATVEAMSSGLSALLKEF